MQSESQVLAVSGDIWKSYQGQEDWEVGAISLWNILGLFYSSVSKDNQRQPIICFIMVISNCSVL